MKIRILRCWGMSLALFSVVGCQHLNHASEPSGSAPATISANDPRFLYEGRFDFSPSNAPVVIWQASRISLDFEGSEATLLFGEAKGQSYFDATVDGQYQLVKVKEGTMASGIRFTGLDTNRHHLVLFKRTEASAGIAHFLGLRLGANAQAWRPATPNYKLRMEFIGDSITVGACAEDGPADLWDDRRTHTCVVNYSGLTALAYSADYRNIAVSGMGLVTGWVPVKAGEAWNRLYPEADAPMANLTEWTPDLVLVNLGENDDSYPRAHKLKFPNGFTEKYVALIEAVRRAYPRAQIVMLRGGMYGGTRSAELRQAWEPAVESLEARDPNLHHFVFQHWTVLHPRTADHKLMADELIRWLRDQPWMQPWR